MRLLNYNKKTKKYKHITLAERAMIETQYNCDKKSKKEISVLLYKSGRTIRNAIYSEIIFDKVKKGKIIYKKEYKRKNKEKRVSKLIPAEKSIEYRPKEANIRSVYGHWEGDLVVGKQGT